MSLRRFYIRVYEQNISQFRCLSLFLVMFSCTYLFLPPRGHKLRPPCVIVLTHTSASNAIASQPPAMPNVRMSLSTQSVHSFYFPPRPLYIAPLRFKNMIRFDDRTPLIRMSTHAHKRLLVRNVVSMLPVPAISMTRLYKVIRWSSPLRCAPMMRSKTRWCTMRSVEQVPGEGSMYCTHTVGPRLPRPLPFGS